MDDNTLLPPNPTQAVPPVTPETPESLHARAMTHLHNARNLYLQQLQSKPPTPEHHRVGLGIMAAALGLAALDPTRNKLNTAGSAFYSHYRAAQQQRDDEANQRAQSQYQRQGAINMARSGFETEDAARALQDKKDLEDTQESDKKDARQAKLDEFNQTIKKAALDGQNHRAEISQKAKDIEGYRKLLSHPYPFARMIGVSGLRAHLLHDRPGVQEAGYDPTELEKSLDEAEKNASKPTPKDQAAIDLAGARTEQVKGKTKQEAAMAPLKQNELKTRTQREQSATGLTNQRTKNLAQTYEWAPKEFQAKLAKTYSDIARNRAMIEKAGRSGKAVNPNDKWILAANRDLSQRMREVQGQIHDQQKTIKDNVAGAANMSDEKLKSDSLAAIADARAKIKQLQTTFSDLGRNGEEIGNMIRSKAGLKPISKPKAKPAPKPTMPKLPFGIGEN